MNTIRSKRHEFKYASLALAAVLAACGGGGSDTPSSDPGTGVTPPVVTPAALTLSGVAATGAAIGGKTVEAKCATGTGSATSNADGSYTISVTSGALPCMLKVTPASGPALYSLATGSGSTATANISPVTQLVIANLTGTDPDAYFTGFDATAAAAVTTTKVGDAVAAVKSTLLAAGVDLGTIDVLAGTLTPATSTTTGNAYDQALDALAAKLATAGTTLAALTTTVVATSPAAPVTVTTAAANTASLPAELLLKPAAATCSALRSATYRVLMPTPNSTLADQYGTMTINAATLAVVYADGSPSTWVAHATEACRFTDETAKSDIVVSQAGVIVGRSYESISDTDHAFRPIIAFPEQTHTMADVSGTWNVIGLNANDATPTAYFGGTATATVDATGVFSAISNCGNEATWDVATCATPTGLQSTRVLNAAGGFDVVEKDPANYVSGRGFVYRAGGGALMRVEVYDRGDFTVWTQLRKNDLPAVDRVSTTWDLRISNLMLATPALLESTNTVKTVDTTAGSFVRLAKTVGGTDDHLETVLVNSPRDGFNFRAAATVTGTDGTTVVSVTEWTNLALRGMGLNALTRPAQKQFMFSVQQP
jgi:hypothetical protein